MNKSNYEVEVLVNGKALREYPHDGRVYVEGKKGSTFSIRLCNNSGSRKLFVPSIDGLSVMNGDECSFDSSGYIVRPYSALTIDGWRINDEEVAQFYFSSPTDSYRKRMEKGNNLGVIGVAVFNEKERPYIPPIVIEKHIHPHYCHSRWCNWCHAFHGCCNPCNNGIMFLSNTTGGSFGTTTTTATASVNSLSVSSHASGAAGDSQVKASYSAARQDLGTGWGENKKSEVTSVEFERDSSPSATFEIYYNTRDQLEKLGVNFRKETVYVAPQAFPGQYCRPPKQ